MPEQHKQYANDFYMLFVGMMPESRHPVAKGQYKRAKQRQGEKLVRFERHEQELLQDIFTAIRATDNYNSLLTEMESILRSKGEDAAAEYSRSVDLDGVGNAAWNLLNQLLYTAGEVMRVKYDIDEVDYYLGVTS